MKTVFKPTAGMVPTDTSYCPGCSHGIAHRLIMECLEERGDLGRAIGVVPIGCAIKDIPAGSWVHLHVMRSLYDERSSHLDEHTGAPRDTKYE